MYFQRLRRGPNTRQNQLPGPGCDLSASCDIR
jgi:hypothetical protein